MVGGGITTTVRIVRGMFFGWVMVAVGALLMAVGVAPLWSGLPVWNPVLRNGFGWTAGQMSWAFSLTQVQEGSMAPVLGMMVDKLGPRRMVFLGLVVLGAGFVLFSQIQELWHLYVVFVLMSLGSTMSSWLPVMTVLNSWFTRRKTMAMALAQEGFSVSSIFAPVLLAWAIGGTDPHESERFGWRTAALFIGLVCLALAVPLSRLVRNRPEDMGLLPDGDASPPSTGAQGESGGPPAAREEEGFTWQEAIRTRTFWLMATGHATTTVTLGTVYAHLGLLLDDRGFSIGEIGLVVAVFTSLTAVFLPVGGYLGDKFKIRTVAFAFSTVLSLSAVVLVLGQGSGIVFVFAVLFGIGTGGRFAIMTSMRGRYFGRRAFAAISGISVLPTSALLVAGPVVAGMVRDQTGNYTAAFLGIAAISLVGGTALLMMGEPTKPPGRRLAPSRTG